LLAYGMNGPDLQYGTALPVRLKLPRQMGYKSGKYPYHYRYRHCEEHWQGSRWRKPGRRLFLVCRNLMYVECSFHSFGPAIDGIRRGPSCGALTSSACGGIIRRLGETAAPQRLVDRAPSKLPRGSPKAHCSKGELYEQTQPRMCPVHDRFADCV